MSAMSSSVSGVLLIYNTLCYDSEEDDLINTVINNISSRILNRN